MNPAKFMSLIEVPLHSTVNSLLLLQDVDKDVIDAVREYDPLAGAIVALLIVAVASLSTVVVFLFRMYAREAKKKDEQIGELNKFIRTSYHENTQILNDMVRVIDVLTHTTETVGDDVKEELRGFMNEMRTHISVIRNLQAFFGETKRREIYEQRPPDEG